MVLLVLECLLELLDESILPRFLRQLNERLPAGVVGQLRDEGGLQRLQQGRARIYDDLLIPCAAVAWRFAEGVTAVGSRRAARWRPAAS